MSSFHQKHRIYWILSFAFLLVTLCLFHCTQLQNNTRSRSAKPQKTFKRIPLHKKFKRNQAFAFVLPALKPVHGIGVPHAENCKRCHTDIYNEWKQSTHAAALRDLQFQAELAKASSPKWLCLNCHIPVSNQRKWVIKFLKNGSIFHPIKQTNPNYSPAMRQEAITCATCHIRPDKNGNSVIIGAIGSKKAPHPIRKDPSFLRNICLRCHEPKGDRLTRQLMCWFKTKEELDANPLRPKKDCVSCHMPTTRRHLVPAWTHLTKRKSHMHHWVGGGVPKSFAAYKHLLKRGYVAGLDFVLTTPSNLTTPHFEQTLSVKNTRSGHWFPTADPERFLLLISYLENKKGEKKQIQKKRIGQTWKWYPMAQKIGDNRLKPQEERHWKINIKLPKNRKGWILKTIAYHVRLPTGTAKYMRKHASKNKWLPLETRQKLKEIGKHYPLATLLFREDLDVHTQKRTKYTTKQLLQLSQKERLLPLEKRDY